MLDKAARLISISIKGRVGWTGAFWMKDLYAQQFRMYQRGTKLPFYELQGKTVWKNLVVAPPIPYYIAFLGGIPCLIFCPPFARIVMARIQGYPKILVEEAGKLQMTYLALVMTFIGALHWGVCMADCKDLACFSNQRTKLRLMLGILPMITALPMSMLMHIGPCSLLFTLMLGGQWTLDLWLLELMMIPPWWCQVRGPIAFWAACCSTITWADCAGEAMTRGTQRKKGAWNLNLWDPRGSFKNPMFDIPNDEKLSNAQEHFDLVNKLYLKREERARERELKQQQRLAQLSQVENTQQQEIQIQSQDKQVAPSQETTREQNQNVQQ
eukprot:TRINITY_DN19257_c1_g1_i2.p1 TRINITY_DN19257_c1_g1~~TRINITY_DN19257_c1_g1_i2.p1  ORF type:complete len:326 (-),score=39.37 TRINITY_DN19257_c1_g1_i2:131-1108(-)